LEQRQRGSQATSHFVYFQASSEMKAKRSAGLYFRASAENTGSNTSEIVPCLSKSETIGYKQQSFRAPKLGDPSADGEVNTSMLLVSGNLYFYLYHSIRKTTPRWG
jgi:hypothetical protein